MNTTTQKVTEKDSLQLVRSSYWKGIVGSTCLVGIALCVSYLINRFYPLSDRVIGFLQAFSIVPGAAGLFGVPGWEIQTWGGESAAEQLNQKLFNRFSIAGLFLPVVAFSLTSSSIESMANIEERILVKLKAELTDEFDRRSLIQNERRSSLP